MKSLVCFGDSNTWAYIPGSGGKRYPYEKRWTSVLAKEMGSGYNVIPEGLNGRTTVFEDPLTGNKSGLAHLDMVLTSHYPIDLLILMLGTNDLKERFNVTASGIAKGMGRLVECVSKSNAGIDGAPPKLLLVCPPPILDAPVYREEFLEGVGKSAGLKKEYKKLSVTYGIPVCNACDYLSSSPVDGIHWTEEGHKIFGTGIAGIIREIV